MRGLRGDGGRGLGTRPGAGDAAGERPAGQPGRRRSRAGTAPRSAGRAGDPAAAQGPAGSARSSWPARASPQRAAVRYRLAVPRGAHSPGSAGPLRPLPPRPAVTPVPLQALDDLLRCGICYDYYNIAMIIPQCSHNCEYGRSERRAPGSAPVPSCCVLCQPQQHGLRRGHHNAAVSFALEFCASRPVINVFYGGSVNASLLTWWLQFKFEF